MIAKYLKKLNKYALSYNKKIDYNDILYELEDELLEQDVPIKIIDYIINNIKSSNIDTYHTLKKKINNVIFNLLKSTYIHKLNISDTILVLGLQGSGKTTTVMKLAYMLKSHTMIGLDTTRAGAMDQINQNGRKIRCPVIYSRLATNPIDYLSKIKLPSKYIIDTAGYSKEMKKSSEIIKKIIRLLPINVQIFYIVDSTQGIANLTQIKWLSNIVNITGFILTKMDSQMYVGSILSIAYYFKNIPIYYIGHGEYAKDLRRYNLDYTQKIIFGIKKQKITKKDIINIQKKIINDEFTLLDCYKQIEDTMPMMQNVSIIKNIPLLNDFMSNISTNDMLQNLYRHINMFRSMTYKELTDKKWQKFINDKSRLKRWAIGSGQTIETCRNLLVSCKLTMNSIKKIFSTTGHNNKKKCTCKKCLQLKNLKNNFR